MVADNCHSSKRHKFVNFRLNFNYFELKLKKVNRNIIFFSIELEIDSLLFIFNTKQNIFIMK